MPRAGLTAERLIEVAASLADEIGFEAVTPSVLARQVGVQVASLYSHLDSAHALKTGIALLALDRLARNAADAVAGRSGRDALVALAAVHRDFARTHPGLFAASRFPLDASAAAHSSGPRLAGMIRAALRGYGLSEPEQTHAARLLGSVFLGFPLLELAGGFSHSAPDPEESWWRGLDALDAVLRGWAAAPARPA